jgi:zinc transport system substrate-binding protein
MVGSYRCALFALIIGITQASLLAPASAGPLYPNVMVTTEVLKPLVDEVLSGITQSTSLLASNQNPHTSELRPSQIKALRQADVIIAPDANASPGLKSALNDAKKRGKIILYLTALENAEALGYRAFNPWLHTHAHHPKTTDPHLWLDPLRMANVMPDIAAAIASYSPEYETQLQRNAANSARHLRAVTFPAVRDYLTSETPDPSRIAYISTHDAYHYFETRFDLPSSGFFYQLPEEYTGARTTAELLKKAKKTSARCVIADTQSRNVNTLASALHADVIVLSPERLPEPAAVPPASWYANNYDRLLMAIAHQFSRCMR